MDGSDSMSLSRCHGGGVDRLRGLRVVSESPGVFLGSALSLNPVCLTVGEYLIVGAESSLWPALVVLSSSLIPRARHSRPQLCSVRSVVGLDSEGYLSSVSLSLGVGRLQL